MVSGNALAQPAILVLIIGMGVVNFSLRFAPLAALSRLRLPEGLMRWLSYVPAAVMGALLATEVLIPALEVASGGGSGSNGAAGALDALLLLRNAGIYGALAAMLAYKLSKSFIGSTVAGVVVYVLIQWLVGV